MRLWKEELIKCLVFYTEFLLNINMTKRDIWFIEATQAAFLIIE